MFVCAPGAGGRKDDPAMRRLARILEPLGVQVAAFEFPYQEKRSRRIDPPGVLAARFEREVSRARRELQPKRLLIGGRSMGARIASILAADGLECDGLLLFAYPLHPAGKPEMLRDAHLPRIRCPVLCFNGTRDALCRRELMEITLANVRAPWTQHWIEGADHSFRLLKSSGRTDAEVDADIGAAAACWLAAFP